MRFPKKKITARTTAFAVALGMIAVLVTALPAFAAVPTVTSLTPNIGAPGISVQINGTGFTASGNATAVTFNGVAATSFVVNSDNLITAVTPCSTTGSVHVTTPGGTDANTVAFAYSAAAAPTITSFSPTAGTAGSTSVVITGTSFCGATSVLFNSTAATTKTINSANQITATVPTGATTGSISVTTLVAPTATSTASFTVGLPVITSFSPTTGLAGTTVVIIGKNLLNVSSVKFNGLAAVFTVNSATRLTTTVPPGATTGPVSVTNAVGTATGGTFTLGVAVAQHDRSVTLMLRKHLIASGTVRVADGFNACWSNVTVRIQRIKSGVWKTVGTDQTTGTGRYKKVLKDKTGKYRAIAKKQFLIGGNDICMAATSPPRTHHH